MTVFIGESMSIVLASLPAVLPPWPSCIFSAFSRSLTLSALRAALCFVMIVISMKTSRRVRSCSREPVKKSPSTAMKVKTRYMTHVAYCGGQAAGDAAGEGRREGWRGEG